MAQSMKEFFSRRSNRASKMVASKEENDSSSDESDCDNSSQAPTKSVGAFGAILGSTREANALAAAWRRRVQRRNHEFDILKELGPLAPAAAGGLLCLVNKTGVKAVPLEVHSRWRPTLESSQLYKELDEFARGRLGKCERKPWKRMERTIRALGQMICLAVQDLDDPGTNLAWNQFKVWFVTEATKQGALDETVSLVKKVGKCALSLILGTAPDTQGIPVFPDGVVGPFGGQLFWISEVLTGAKSARKWTLEEARSLAQLASVSRALPYPSPEQTNVSVKESVDAFTSPVEVSNRALSAHARGLRNISKNLGVVKSQRTHLSLSNSSCFESTRSTGGRSAYLVAAAKRSTEVTIDGDVLSQLSGSYDCYGQEIISAASAAFVEMRRPKETDIRLPTVGDVAYVPLSELSAHLDRALAQPKRVPKQLGAIIANVSSFLVTEFGYYKVRPNTRCDKWHTFMVFDKSSNPVFEPTVDALPVRAGLSIEAGLKTRLTTAASAGFVQISQLVSNKLRDHLSKDPFLRVGFEEADKLWEVLKAYDKHYALGSL